jgi:hypothetical protein
MARRDSIVLLFVASALAHAQPTSEKIEFFEARIRPVLANNCYSCHTDSKPGDLRVDSRVALLAGGGARPGTVYGATDDFAFKAAQNPVHVQDLHATALHLPGMDHEKLTYRYAGRDFRLTDVEGRVVKDII